MTKMPRKIKVVDFDKKKTLEERVMEYTGFLTMPALLLSKSEQIKQLTS